MYVINEQKVYADYAEGQYIVLNHVTGEYYSFDRASSAVLGALLSGADESSVTAAFLEKYGPVCGAAPAVAKFVAELLEAGIITAAASAAEAGQVIPEAEAGAALLGEIADKTMPELGFEAFSDVADLLLMDPIHEVDEEMGWPVPKQEG